MKLDIFTLSTKTIETIIKEKFSTEEQDKMAQYYDYSSIAELRKDYGSKAFKRWAIMNFIIG